MYDHECLLKSHWDLRHTIATPNPDLLVLTETKICRNIKPRAWMETLLKNFEYCSAFEWTCDTTICVCDIIALATQCSPACLNFKGRIVILHGANANLLLLGTYWPSASFQELLEALNSRIEMLLCSYTSIL
eukprot:317289-Pelagomonas_calceolata.AAC.1